MSAPEPVSLLGPAGAPGHRGAITAHRLALASRPVDIVQVAALRGGGAATKEALRGLTGLDLPPPRRAAVAGEGMAVWLQPECWLVLRPRGPAGEFAEAVSRACGSAAAVTDQTGGKAVLRLSGAMARRVLAKGCRVDLHPRAFATGHAASTPIGHVSVTLVQVADQPAYDLILPGSFAEAFLEWLIPAAAEFGLTIT